MGTPFIGPGITPPTPLDTGLLSDRFNHETRAVIDELADNIGRVLIALKSEMPPDFTCVRYAFLSARTLDSIMFTKETFDGRFVASDQALVQDSFLGTARLLLAASQKYSPKEPGKYKGVDGKLRNDRQIFEADAFQIFSWTRNRALRYEQPLPFGMDGAAYYDTVQGRFLETTSRVKAALKKSQSSHEELRFLFGELDELTGFLLSSASRFPKDGAPSHLRTGRFRRNDVSTVKSEFLNDARACSFDATTTFKLMMSVSRCLDAR